MRRIRCDALCATLCAALCACSTASLPALPAPSGDTATVFVPGYKGSFLADDQGDRPWLTPGAALSGGDRSLALPFPGDHLGPHFGPLHPDGPMTRLSVLGIGEDVYLHFLEFAARSLPSPVAFAYDWRQDIRESGRALCERIAQLHAKRVTIIAHSMGGLVTLACLRQGAPSVQGVVFAGTPFLGSPKIFHDFVLGDSAGRNHALLSPEALFTFASAFQLMPPDAAFLPGGEPFSPAWWTGQGLGVFADPARRTDAAYTSQLQRMLAAHDQLVREERDTPPPPRALVVVGLGRPTVDGVRLQGGRFDFDHPPLADGDGTVTATSARPGFPHDELVSKAAHTALLDDPDVQRAIQAFAGAR